MASQALSEVDILAQQITELYDADVPFSNDIAQLLDKFLQYLNRGIIRAAAPNADGSWTVYPWVKQGILLCFRYGTLTDMTPPNSPFSFFDKRTLPLHPFTLEDRVRIVPGGSAIRSGAYIASGVICMPPMYINIGAYVDTGTMIDSHVLVGSCAQIGKSVHLSAGVQIGGVLEPPNAQPVIIEDDAFIGALSGIFEGVRVRRRAVIASGVILTSSTPVYDVVHQRILKSSAGQPLEIPPNAVVVPGSRPLHTPFADQHQLAVYTPIIIKYRDAQTDAKTILEQTLR